MFYWADLGYPGRKSLFKGPLIILEAQSPEASIAWSANLSPDNQSELDRLREDGHGVAREGRRWIIRTSLAATRATHLYRTLPHEIGRWVDYRARVARPAEAGGNLEVLQAAYFARQREEREAFAHRFADETRDRLKGLGCLPFDPIPRNAGLD